MQLQLLVVTVVWYALFIVNEIIPETGLLCQNPVCEAEDEIASLQSGFFWIRLPAAYLSI